MLLNRKDRKIRLLYTATGLVVALACQKATAGAFQLHEQNTAYLGSAYSGTASSSEDCSTGYYNPAGLGELKHNQAALSAIYFDGHIKLRNATGTTTAGAAATGSANSNVGSNAIIPAFHTSAKVNHKWSVGLGVVTPFGLSTKYPSDSVARYVATTSSIETFDITPSVSFKINEQFSIGAGFDAMYVKAKLYSAVNVGAEGYIQNTGHSWAYGYHVGVLFKPSCCTHMGLVYFSGFDTTTKGDVTSSGVPGAARSSFYARVHLPDRLVYSITHKYSAKWTALGDVEWTHWSRLQDLTLVYNTGAMSRLTLNNRNSWRVALGAAYTSSDRWKFKGGVAWDQSPVRDAFRIANLPDSNKVWIALGAKYQVNKAFHIDAGYAHFFGKKCSINEVGTGASSLVGNYKSSADMIGVQLTWSFA